MFPEPLVFYNMLKHPFYCFCKNIVCRYCGAPVWDCCSPTTINQLQEFKNRAARILADISCDASIEPQNESRSWKTIRALVGYGLQIYQWGCSTVPTQSFHKKF